MLNNMPAASISRQATAPPVRNGLAGAGGQNGRPVATQCGKLSRPSSAASQNGRERSLTTGARRALMPRLLRGSGHRRRPTPTPPPPHSPPPVAPPPPPPASAE